MTNTTADDQKRVLDAVPDGLLVGGELLKSGPTFDVLDPATQEVLVTVRDATAADGLAALDAADGAQAEWAATPPRVRGEILRKAFELLTARADDFALLITLEMGKPVQESLGEVRYGAEFLRWFSEEAVRINGQYNMAPTGDARHMIVKKPVGPCVLIAPWNFPLAMITRKVAPALAAGCTSIVKPAAQTPLTALAFGALLTEAGVPAGVVNVLPTTDAGALITPLLSDPRVRKLSFTGSTGVGRLLGKQAADQVLRVSLELGGNAPFLVFDDADIDAAIEGAMLAKMRNGGEACTSANRFLVHESVADEFIEGLVSRMTALKSGRGTEAGVQVGPLIDEAAVDKVARLVEDAEKRGAKVAVGGARVGETWFWEPTVIRDVPSDAAINGEEVFGPVAPITTFSSDSEAIRMANDTQNGLVSYAYTRSLDRTLGLAERLETGMIGLNRGMVSDAAAPFGGVKQSGLGREGGRNGIDEYLETTYVSLPAPQPST